MLAHAKSLLDIIFALVHYIPMESSEHPSRLSGLQEPVQGLHKVGWLERLRTWRQREHGGDVMNFYHGDTDGEEDSGEAAEVSAETESATEEFLALLPEGAAHKLGLDETANHPIYPDALDIGLADFDRTNPAVWASDWRLLAPSDSDAYKEAVRQPKDITADKDVNQVIDTVAKSLSPSD